MPPQQNMGQPGNQYDFIVNPPPPPKKPIVPGLGAGSSFAKKLTLIIGGAVILIIVMWVIGNVVGGTRINRDDILTLMQEQQEIARVSQEGLNTTRADIKNASINMQLSLLSQQQLWLQFLANRGIEIKTDQLQLLKNASTDQLLTTARSNNTFDTSYLQAMNNFLNDYAAQIKSDYGKASSDSERQLLNDHYSQAQLLLQQLPDK